jgi:hypothetical protein
MGPAVAQTPMSPLYPTTPAKPGQAPAVPKAVQGPGHEPSKASPPAAQTSAAEGAPVATAVIPPPLVETPPASAEPKKPSTSAAHAGDAAEPHPTVKHRKRTARRSRYARRSYVLYPRWYYDSGAANRGWGGGQFGPSPYSTSGQ